MKKFKTKIDPKFKPGDKVYFKYINVELVGEIIKCKVYYTIKSSEGHIFYRDEKDIRLIPEEELNIIDILE